MKQELSKSQYLSIASMLFGLFFGAGNLIFPVSMGQLAGSHVWAACAGFLITGVGLPLLGVTALGVSCCNGLTELSRRVGKRYGTFFTCALYLTIGPFFAIPRCATVPFSMGVEPLLTTTGMSSVFLAVFSGIFFLIVLCFSLRPGKILTFIGKILNPLFLLFLSGLILTSILYPMGRAADVLPAASYTEGAFLKGFLEGYNTMDALAGLAFGIIVVNVIRSLGVTHPAAIARCTVKAGILSSLLMAVIYVLVALIGTQSRGLFPPADNGGIALASIARHYYGGLGAFLLASMVTLACLKTSIGLITSCSETFVTLFPQLLSYEKWAVLFTAVSFLIANLGLSTIIRFSLPVLMFLYPLSITLTLLSLSGPMFGNRRIVYVITTAGALSAAVFDFLNALPDSIKDTAILSVLLDAARRYLPFFSQGMGWLLPSAAAFGLSCIYLAVRRRLSAQD